MKQRDTMTCAWVDENLCAYADGELNREEREAIKAHLDTCPSCRAALEEIEALGALVASTAEEGDVPSTSVRAAVMAAVAAEPRRRPHRTGVVLRYGSMAAALICVLGVAVALMLGGPLAESMVADDAMDWAPGGAAPMEPSVSKGDDAPMEDGDAEDSVADNVTNVPEVMPPADDAPDDSDTPAAEEPADAPSQETDDSCEDGWPVVGKLYVFEPLYGALQDNDGSLGALLDGEWTGDGCFLSFVSPSGEVKMQWDGGDVYLGTFALNGDVLTIRTEQGDVLEFHAEIWEGCLCLTLR